MCSFSSDFARVYPGGQRSDRLICEEINKLLFLLLFIYFLQLLAGVTGNSVYEFVREQVNVRP